MKVLFAVNNEAIAETIVKKYQQMYKEIISSKNVYYFNAILKELQKDKTYDRVVISEDLEPFTNNNFETIDNFIFDKLDSISDEASTTAGEDIPIIVIATDRRTKSDNLLIKLFGIGVYSALIGQDRSIDEVCKLLHKPRTKKEAKLYYQIDSNDVKYEEASEDLVSETEIQNILSYYKRQGKNEERYVEIFDNIATQYTDQQLKVIIKFLPLNVKAMLEASSPKYQQLMSFGGQTSTLNQYKKPTTKRKNNTTKAISNQGIKIESIPSGEKKLTKPVIIPSAGSLKQTKKTAEPAKKTETKMVEKKASVVKEVGSSQPVVEKVQKEPPKQEEPVKKKRGRPKKVQTEEPAIEQLVTEEPVKKKRGRPKKQQPLEETEEAINLFGLEEEEEVITPQPILEDTTLPGFEMEEEEDSVLPGFDEKTSYQTQERVEEFETQLPEYRSPRVNLQNLLTQDKKIVAFVGTSKNGISFLVNNLGEMLSREGIKTAILDLTNNRNAYYIYTKNEEELRKTAYSCMEQLTQGMANGIKVNQNLDVYTSLPGEEDSIEQYPAILETLVKNYSLILLDCDFKTPYGYLKEAQEVYLVQSMDVLTIQPLTAYLRELKAKDILREEKLRVIINKYIKVRSVAEKAIIGGLSFYNDPAMSYMTDLFNRETIPYSVIPFDGQVYSKYLEGLVNCKISLNGYPKEMMASLKKLANMIYPLITSNTANYGKAKYNDPKYNKYAKPFSNNMNTTLNKMKRKF